MKRHALLLPAAGLLAAILLLVSSGPDPAPAPPAMPPDIEAGAIGCVGSARHALTVEPGIGRNCLDLVVVREGFRLSGKVFGVRGPISGVRVDYTVIDREHRTRPGGRTITAADGTYELPLATRLVEVVEGEVTRVDFRVP